MLNPHAIRDGIFHLWYGNRSRIAVGHRKCSYGPSGIRLCRQCDRSSLPRCDAPYFFLTSQKSKKSFPRSQSAKKCHQDLKIEHNWGSLRVSSTFKIGYRKTKILDFWRYRTRGIYFTPCKVDHYQRGITYLSQHPTQFWEERTRTRLIDLEEIELANHRRKTKRRAKWRYE